MCLSDIGKNIDHHLLDTQKQQEYSTRIQSILDEIALELR